MPSRRSTRKGGARRRGGGTRRVRRGGSFGSAVRKAALPALLLWGNTVYKPGKVAAMVQKDLGLAGIRRRAGRRTRAKRAKRSRRR